MDVLAKWSSYALDLVVMMVVKKEEYLTDHVVLITFVRVYLSLLTRLTPLIGSRKLHVIFTGPPYPDWRLVVGYPQPSFKYPPHLNGIILWIQESCLESSESNCPNMSAAPTYLCPGYKEVEEFGPDEEYEEEEVFYVSLDMGNVEPTLVPTSSSYRLIVSLTTDLG